MNASAALCKMYLIDFRKQWWLTNVMLGKPAAQQKVSDYGKCFNGLRLDIGRNENRKVTSL